MKQLASAWRKRHQSCDRPRKGSQILSPNAIMPVLALVSTLSIGFHRPHVLRLVAVGCVVASQSLWIRPRKITGLETME